MKREPETLEADCVIEEQSGPSLRDYLKHQVEMDWRRRSNWIALHQTYAVFDLPDLIDFCQTVIARSSCGSFWAYVHMFSAAGQLGRLREFAEEMEFAVRAFPKSARLQHQYAVLLEDIGKHEQAIMHHIVAANLDPTNPELHFSLACSYLERDFYELGWREFEWRFSLGRVGYGVRSSNWWDGRVVPGKSLLVRAEQGRGDVIQFWRFLQELSSSMHIVVQAYPDLYRLLNGTGNVAVVPTGAPVPETDFECSLLSLPYLLKLGRQHVDVGPYLTLDPYIQAHWESRLASKTGLRVGVVWAGNPQFGQDSKRSLAASSLTPLANIKGVQIVNLQMGATPTDLLAWARAGDFTDLMPEVRDFADTAAIVNCLDLVIGVDTAVIHLGGALGVPTWLLNRAPSHWTWRQSGHETPWYRSVRQFRQSVTADWGAPLQRVCAELKILAVERTRS